MLKSLSLAVVVLFLSVSVSASASASTYGIMGGMVVSGGAIGLNPVVVQFDGRELFLSEMDCKAALEKVLTSSAYKATTNTSGAFDPTAKWAVVNPLTKINLAACVKTTQF